MDRPRNAHLHLVPPVRPRTDAPHGAANDAVLPFPRDPEFETQALRLDHTISRQQLANARAEIARLRKKLDDTFEALPCAALEVDSGSGLILRRNKQARRLFGTADAHGEVTLPSLGFSAKDKAELAEALVVAVAIGICSVPQLRLQVGENASHLVHARLLRLVAEPGQAPAVQISFQDRSTSFLRQWVPQPETLQLHRLLSDMPGFLMFMMETDQGNNFLFATGGFEELWNQPVARLYEDAGIWRDGLHPDDRSTWDAMLAEDLPASDLVPLRVMQPDGGWVTVVCRLGSSPCAGRKSGVLMVLEG